MPILTKQSQPSANMARFMPVLIPPKWAQLYNYVMYIEPIPKRIMLHFSCYNAYIYYRLSDNAITFPSICYRNHAITFPSICYRDLAVTFPSICYRNHAITFPLICYNDLICYRDLAVICYRDLAVTFPSICYRNHAITFPLICYNDLEVTAWSQWRYFYSEKYSVNYFGRYLS